MLNQTPKSRPRAETPARGYLETQLRAPYWLTLQGESRARYETLSGQFRAGGSGGDQALALRTLVGAEANLAPLGASDATIGLELQDSRMLLDDAGTPLSTSIVNALDVLQAYVRFDLDGRLGQRDASLTLGRQTLDIGSRRVLERVDMANVIFSYTGAYWRSVTAKGNELHIVHVSPVGRLPATRPALDDDEIVADREEWGRRFWGIHHRAPGAFESMASDIWGEVFLYRLIERDTKDVQTPNRNYWQPGFRLFRAPKTGRSDFELEASWRGGSRRATSLATDVRDLDVNAWTVHAHAGWSFVSDWKWRIGVDFDYASGDKNPSDQSFEQFERLFGGRRTDLGNTGIHGPLTPTNLIAPGARVELSPTQRLDLRLAYKAAWLDSATDAWTVARVRDTAGRSGRFIGHTFDTRLRYWLIPNKLRGEAGVSALLPGEFAKSAPNAADFEQTLFGYTQLAFSF